MDNLQSWGTSYIPKEYRKNAIEMYTSSAPAWSPACGADRGVGKGILQTDCKNENNKGKCKISVSKMPDNSGWSFSKSYFYPCTYDGGECKQKTDKGLCNPYYMAAPSPTGPVSPSNWAPPPPFPAVPESLQKGAYYEASSPQSNYTGPVGTRKNCSSRKKCLDYEKDCKKMTTKESCEKSYEIDKASSTGLANPCETNAKLLARECKWYESEFGPIDGDPFCGAGGGFEEEDDEVKYCIVDPTDAPAAPAPRGLEWCDDVNSLYYTKKCKKYDNNDGCTKYFEVPSGPIGVINKKVWLGYPCRKKKYDDGRTGFKCKASAADACAWDLFND
jgi:hypothetical protein